MKNSLLKLITLILTCSIIFSGCGENPNNGVANKTAPENEEVNDNIDTSEPQKDPISNMPESVAPTEAGNNTAPEASAAIASPSDTPAADAGLLTGEKHTVTGIITDATQYSLSMQTPEGFSYYLTIPETGVTGNLNYIIIGQMVSLTYMGSLDENHAVLTGIYDSTLNTGIYLEEYAFAIKIINAVRAMDMKALSDLTNFPVFIDTGNYNGPMNTSGEFEVIDNEKIFTEALVTRMVNYNLFDLTYTDAGFVMGNGTPSITFDADDDGILGIIGINSAAAPASDK